MPPIEPDRPEAIYTKYVATKEAWLSAHPTVLSSEYREAAGLKHWDRRYCQEQAMAMPLDRLDPKTGREIDRLSFPRWTIEEIEAYLDYHAELDRRAEEWEARRGRFLAIKR